MAIKKWSDNITTSALQGNYDGYIQSSLLQLRLSGPISDSATNGIAVYNIKELTKYKVRLLMDTRFRVAACSSIAMNTVMENYYRDEADTNGTTSVAAYKETEITSQAGQVYMPVFYWASGSGKGWSEVYSTLEVREELTGRLELTTPPSKTQYTVGEELDLTGMVVSVVWSNGTKEPVTEYTVSGYDGAAVGSYTVTVAYQGETVSFQVTVASPGILFETLLNTTDGMEVIRNNIENDDGTDAVEGVDWFTYAGKIVSTVYVGGNNWIGFGISSGHLKICNRDGAVYYVYRQEGVLDKGIKFLKIRVEGYTYYGSTTAQYKLVYEVFLFDDGNLYINVLQTPTNTFYIGTSSITDGINTATLTIPAGVTPTTPIEVTVSNAGVKQEIAYERYVPFVPIGIEASSLPDKTTYYGNELFDESGLIVNCVDAEGNTKVVTDYTLSGFNISTPGIKTITITSGKFSTSFQVTVSDISITGVEVSALPEKTVYILADTLDIAGLEVQFQLSEGSRVPADRYIVNDLDSATSGQKTITVTYASFVTSFEVTVLEPEGIEVSRLPKRAGYLKDEAFLPGGLIISEVYQNGARRIVTDYELSGFDSSTEGEKTIIVTHNGYTATFSVTVSKYAVEYIGIPNSRDVVATLDTETGNLIISGTGKMLPGESEDNLYPILVDYRDLVQECTIEEGIENISRDAFTRCRNMARVKLPNTLSGKLESCFTYCDALEEVEIPGGVQEINTAFQNCTSLRKVVLNEGLEIINYSAFYGCKKLETINFPLSLEQIVGPYCFSGTPLKEIRIKAAQIIKDGAFNGMSQLEKVTIGSGVIEIVNGVFSGCTTLKELIIENGIKILDYGAFGSCSGLLNVELPASLETLGAIVFGGCTALKKIRVNGKDTQITDASAIPETTTIVAYLDSPAHQFAVENHRAFEPIDATLERIEITSLPSKLNYNIGDTLDTAGMVVTAVYSEGYMAVITDYTLSGFDSSSEGQKTVTVTYQGMTAAFEVAVSSSISEYIGTPNLRDVVAVLDLKTYELTISGNGAIRDYSSDSSVMLDYADSIAKVVVESGVTATGEYSFGNYSSLTEADIAGTVTDIGNATFFGCTRLQSAKLEYGVKIIGRASFYECSSLTKITLAGTVTELQDSVFHGCISLENIDIPESVTIIGNGVFNSCEKLENIVIPSRVKQIRIRTFFDCISLKSVNILGNITEIMESAFSGCDALSSINLPDGLKSIGNHAFYSCASLKSIDIPQSVSVIQDYAFNACTGLEKVSLPDKMESIGEGAFFRCSSLEEIVLPNGITKIADGTFYDCPNLKTVKIPDSVILIESSAFVHCISIRSIEMPKELTVISSGAFNYCTGLESITIPENVQEIGSGAFDSCENLAHIYVRKKKDSISGSPWGAPTTTEIVWLKEPKSISVSRLPDKLDYNIGEMLDTTGMIVEATLYDGSTEAVTGYTLSELDSMTIGAKTITVTYQGLTTTIEVRVHGAVEGIRISHYPNKVYYKIGDTLDTTGMEVMAITEGGLERVVTDYTLSAFDSSKVGNKQITVSYEVPVDAETTAVYLAHFSVKVTATGDNPFEGKEPITVKVHWINGEFADLGNDDLTGAVVLQESICNANYFIFGGCVCNQIKFTTHSSQFMGTKESDAPHGDIEVYVERKSTRVKIFTGTIDSGKRTAGLTAREIIAYDYLYRNRNTDIVWWLRNKTTDKQMVLTQLQFRRQLFDFLGIKEVPTKLYYDDAYVPNTNQANSIIVADILKDMCLQNSVFGWVNRDGQFEYLRLPENSRRKSHDNAGNVTYEYFDAEVYVDTYESCEFDEGRIWYPNVFYSDPDPRYGFSDRPPQSAQESYERNVYYNRNSFFIGNADWLDSAWQVDEYNSATVQEPIFPIFFGPIVDMFRLYRAQGYRLTLPGNPLNKVGDTIEITVRKTADDGTQLEWVIHSYIMSRTLTILADGSMTDVYTARNAPYNGNTAQAGQNTMEVAAQVFQLRAEGPVISYADFSDGKSTMSVDGEAKKVRMRCVKRLSKTEYEALRTAGKTRMDTQYDVYYDS